MAACAGHKQKGEEYDWEASVMRRIHFTLTPQCRVGKEAKGWGKLDAEKCRLKLFKQHTFVPQ